MSNLQQRWIYRYAALASFVPWFLSFSFPAYRYTIEYTQTEGVISGLDVFIFGWWGVLNGESFAWLANPAWAYLMIRMLQGRPPHLWIALAAMALAMTALLPFDFSAFDDSADGSADALRGVDVWISSIAVVAVTAVISTLARPKIRTLARSGDEEF